MVPDLTEPDSELAGLLYYRADSLLALKEYVNREFCTKKADI